MRFQCPLCSGIVAVDNSALGIKVQCGHCSGVIDVPQSRVAPGAIVADFIVQKELGRGGMGIVYLAHQISLDRPAALKVLSENYANDAQFVGNFIKEARAAAKLNHPHIVQAYAVGEDEGIFYFAMEDIDGKTMKEVLKEQQLIPSDQALLIVQQIAEALDYAWREQKLIHRDIKPDNIMLTNSGRAKLSDLGLASVAGEVDESNADEVMGTPQYISPEHLTGSPMDVRSDIYSLGATFYHFVTGSFPYQGSTAMEIAQQHLTGTLIPPDAVNPDIPEDVSAIIMKMMARTPSERYQSTEQLIDDIRTARHAVDGVTATIQLPAPGTAPKPAKKTGGLRLATNHTSGKQLTLKKSGTATATNMKLTGVAPGKKAGKKGKSNKKLVIGLCAGIGGVLLLAGAAAAAILLMPGNQAEEVVQETANIPPPPPEPSELEKALKEFNAKALTATNKTELLGECENLILQKTDNMNEAELQAYEKMLAFYHDAEEVLLKAARENAAAAHKGKLQAEAKRIADEIAAKMRKEKEERERKAAEARKEQERKAAAAALKAKRDQATKDLAELKKTSAAAIVEACSGDDPAANAAAVEKILTAAIENKYKEETDETIQPQVEELKTWAEGLQQSFRNGAKIADLMRGKDKELDDLVVPAPSKKKQKIKMNYQNARVGITVGGIPLDKFLKIKNNRVYIPFVITAVAEKIEATGDLWAYKMLSNEKRMPKDLDTSKITELKNIAGIAAEEESGDDGDE